MAGDDLARAVEAMARERLKGAGVSARALETIREWAAEPEYDTDWKADQKLAKRLLGVMTAAVERASGPGGDETLRYWVRRHVAPLLARMPTPLLRHPGDDEASAVVLGLGDRLTERQLVAVHVLAFGVDAAGFAGGATTPGAYLEWVRHRIHSAARSR